MTGRPASGQPRPRAGTAVWLGVVAACGVCCAGPVVAVLAALGLTSAVASLAVPAAGLVAVAAVAAAWWLRRRSRQRCAPGDGPAPLPFPARRSAGEPEVQES
jgi:hypothetical protein